MKGPKNLSRWNAKKISQGGEIVRLTANAELSLPAAKLQGLVKWMNLYLGLEASASSDNTFRAKKRDLESFLHFIRQATGSEDPDQWTRSLTSSFMRDLEREQHKKPTSINRVLASLRHAASWIHRRRPFLAGNPCDRIAELQLDDPEWKGLTYKQVARVQGVAEQLLHLKRRPGQDPVRNYAIFLVLLHTGLRVSELLALDLDQYGGKHFHTVKRKGKKVSRQVFLSKEARVALDRYLESVPDRKGSPLFQTKNGNRLSRQDVDYVLKSLALQANASLPIKDHIQLSAHVLRHTMLRRAADKYGVQYAMELAGHTSSQYIWRYVKPTDEQKERAIEELF
jgi:integrase/recombinase XerD